MHVQRFLGSDWASVHGPSDARQFLIWVLEADFRGLVAGPGPRAIDWDAVRAAARDLPFRFSAVRSTSALASQSATAGLASNSARDQQVAQRAIQQAVAVARAIGCPRVLIEPGLVPVHGDIEADDLGETGYQWTAERVDALMARRKVQRNQALDRACRAVFTVVRAFPDIDFCITSGRNLRTVADHDGIRDLFEDLHQLRLGYWHDAAIAARRHQVLGEDQGAWLETFGNRCHGMSLGDASQEGMYLPPGAGGVDYALLATYVPHSGAPFPGVLELDPSVSSAELPGMHACLDKHGL